MHVSIAHTPLPSHSVLVSFVQGTSAEHREVALTLFSSLAEIIGELMASAVPTLIGFVSNGLREQHNVSAVPALT